MMNNIAKSIVAGALISCASTAAMAAEKVGPFEISANVAITSDYVWRGYSQTYKDPAIQGGFDIAHESGAYIGTWASNVRFVDKGGVSDGAHMEADVYAGYAYEFKNGLGLDVGYNRYMYPGANSDANYDFGEFYVSASYSFFTLGYNYSPEFFGNSGKTHYFNLGFEYGLPQDFTLSASVGRQQYSDLDGADYTDWSVGISKSIVGVDVALTYTDTDVDTASDPAELAKGRAVLSVSKSF